MPRPKSPSGSLAATPAGVRTVELLDPDAGGEHVVDDADLAVELERARLDGQRARGLARACVLVEDAHRDAERVSHSASVRPVGPAPTIRTCVCDGAHLRSPSAMRTFCMFAQPVDAGGDDDVALGKAVC